MRHFQRPHADHAAPRTTLRLALAFTALSLIGAPSAADITWQWSFGSESGFFVTDGDLVGGVALPATYNVIDFGVTQSAFSGALGSMSAGSYDEGSQPGTGFDWDGLRDILWFRAGGFYTNGANYYTVPFAGGYRYLFAPDYYVVFDDNDNQLLFSGTLTLTPQTTVGTPFCFGDGSGTQCPCGNTNDGSLADAGCANGQYASGARLTAGGAASLSADSLVLHGEYTENNQSGLYFQANNDLSPGNVWGDGLQCAGGQLKRLGVRFSDGTGYSDTSAWTTPISVKAGNVLAGDTKYYQLWYRNPFNSPCASDFNASNGLAITWAP